MFGNCILFVLYNLYRSFRPSKINSDLVILHISLKIPFFELSSPENSGPRSLGYLLGCINVWKLYLFVCYNLYRSFGPSKINSDLVILHISLKIPFFELSSPENSGPRSLGYLLGCINVWKLYLFVCYNLYRSFGPSKINSDLVV